MKFFFYLVTSLCVSLQVHAQIGIGTTAPDPSSILEVNSNEKGMLAPRMTTLQRDAIQNPAVGLLVYDTDANLFYYFDGGSWIPLQGALVRDNYKLVKSIADLSDELAAGGGSQYLLTSNYLYEINGIIDFDYPINTNGGYIKGEDYSDDILVNNTGGALFVGGNSGSIRRLTVNGNGNPIFEIEGTGNEIFTSTNVNYFNASSLGNIENIGVLYMDVSQFANNYNGLELESIGRLYLNVFEWSTSNTGTFLKLKGNYNNIQMAQGRVTANTGEVGLDVSNNPTVVNSASINATDFDGAGTLVKGYTTGSYPGFNFNNDWNVNANGIPTEIDAVATGNLYITSSALTTISSVNMPVKVAGTTSGVHLFRAEQPTGISNRLIYKGKKERFFKYTATMSVSVGNGANGDTFNFYIYKNGSKLVESKQTRKFSNSDIEAISISGIINLDTDDYIEVWVENMTNTDPITFDSLNLILK